MSHVFQIIALLLALFFASASWDACARRDWILGVFYGLDALLFLVASFADLHIIAN